MTVRPASAIGAALAAAVLLAAGPAAAAGSACRPDTADFRWPGGQARFSIELADDAEEHARGLMFRDSLAASSGMLFIYDAPRRVQFWMKNTRIPLDMIFIGADGRVAAVHPMAVPGDETPIPGPPDTLMVLEINGGLAGRLGIAEGAELRHPALDQSLAAWPCAGP